MNKRFYIVDRPREEVIESGIELLAQSFERKEDACDDVLEVKLVIDREKNFFYFCDQETLEQAREIISIKYPLYTVRNTNLENIKKWES